MKEIEIIEKELALIEDEFDFYGYLSLLISQQRLPEKGIRAEENLVQGCTSLFWGKLEIIENKVFAYCDSDSIFMKGTGLIICRIFNGNTVEECSSFDESLLAGINASKFITETRKEGLLRLFRLFLKECLSK